MKLEDIEQLIGAGFSSKTADLAYQVVQKCKCFDPDPMIEMLAEDCISINYRPEVGVSYEVRVLIQNGKLHDVSGRRWDPSSQYVGRYGNGQEKPIELNDVRAIIELFSR